MKIMEMRRTASIRQIILLNSANERREKNKEENGLHVCRCYSTLLCHVIHSMFGARGGLKHTYTHCKRASNERDREKMANALFSENLPLCEHTEQHGRKQQSKITPQNIVNSDIVATM